MENILVLFLTKEDKKRISSIIASQPDVANKSEALHWALRKASENIHTGAKIIIQPDFRRKGIKSDTSSMINVHLGDNSSKDN